MENLKEMHEECSEQNETLLMLHSKSINEGQNQSTVSIVGSNRDLITLVISTMQEDKEFFYIIETAMKFYDHFNESNDTD